MSSRYFPVAENGGKFRNRTENRNEKRQLHLYLIIAFLFAYSIGSSGYNVFLLQFCSTKKTEAIDVCRSTGEQLEIKNETFGKTFSSIGRSPVAMRVLISNGHVPIRGVNLLGWLVSAWWCRVIRGSPIWKDVPDNIGFQGEYLTMRHLRDNGIDPDVQVDEHRRTFYNESDFEEIAKAGMNTVRIPIGHWIAGFTKSTDRVTTDFPVPLPYVKGGIKYLDMAIREWAPRHNLMVLVNFHAAEGSQNGWEHSSPIETGVTKWGFEEVFVNRSLDVIEWIADRYKYDPSFLGIGLLQEPQKIPEDTLKQYYYDAVDRVRHNVGSNCLLIISPLIDEQRQLERGFRDWDQFMRNESHVFHEWHRYQMDWDPRFNQKPAKTIIDFPRNETRPEIENWTGNPLFIGEWTLQSATAMSKRQLLQYADVGLVMRIVKIICFSSLEVQFDAINLAKGGWVYQFWKFYGEDKARDDPWSMRSLLKKGIFDKTWKSRTNSSRI